MAGSEHTMNEVGRPTDQYNGRDRTAVVALSLATAASVALAIGVRHIWPEKAWLAYVFKPLSTTLLVAIAATAPRSPLALRKWGVVIGLVSSLSGDVLLMLPGDHFLTGLVSFLIAHICYIAAFTSDCDLAARRAPFVVWAFVGAALMVFLFRGIPASLFPAVALYTVVILVMASQASARALKLRSASAVAACIGATLFVLSDGLLATARFRGSLPWSDLLVLVPYFAGQWLIAVSVTFCTPACERAAGKTTPS